jgi:hypothetical protein
MKQKYEGKDLQSLVELGREQGYLTFDQVNDFLPQDVSSPTDLRFALESFQDMDIKILADVPADGTESELEAEVKEGPEETAEPAPAADAIGESSDPVRLYLREMGNFQLLSREREVEVAKRIEAGAADVNDVMINYTVLELPMGGAKASGLGSRHGPGGIRKYCSQQAIVITPKLALKKELFMYPYKSRTSRLLAGLFKLMYGRGKRD